MRRGSAVEVGDTFVVEGIWAGDFEAGDFHRARHFFGSGLVVQGDQLWLVPSRALVDRIVVATVPGLVVASNSLAAVLGATGLSLDPHMSYHPSSHAILKGVLDFDPRIPVRGPTGFELQQRYYWPMSVEASGPATWDPGWVDPDFQSFEEYVQGLRAELVRLIGNAQSRRRARPVRVESTISRGYDSAAVTALTRDIGLEECFTQPRSNSMLPGWLFPSASDDDGTIIAGRLGVPARRMPARSFASALDEIRYLATSTAEPEKALAGLFSAGRLTPRALLTGYHGDKLWSRASLEKPDRGRFIRGDVSGLALAEPRLHAGVLNVPVPMLFARSADAIRAIGDHRQMAKWQVGGTYDRPIPRRILEEAGVPREWFGQRKKAVVQQVSLPECSDARSQFLAWVRATHGVAPRVVALVTWLDRFAFLPLRLIQRIAERVGIAVAEPRGDSIARRFVDLRNALFVWSTGVLAAVYVTALGRDVDSGGA